MPENSNLSVLIVDPNPSMRGNLHNMLNQAAISKVEYAVNSGTAIRLLTKKSFDIILCEYDLGSGTEAQDGQQLLEDLRHHQLVKPWTIFIMLTSEAIHSKVVSAAELTPSDYILKPFTVDVLSGRIARAIEKRRLEEPFVTTRDLAGLIEVVTPRKAKDKIHPATRVFQALRIFVNDELGELAGALFAAERALKPGGRLTVVTFHSLEDRIVKKFFQDRAGKASGSRHLPIAHERAATFAPVGKSMVAASEEEASRNPRARSAKMRVGARTEAPPEADDLSIFDLPNLASLGKMGG